MRRYVPAVFSGVSDPWPMASVGRLMRSMMESMDSGTSLAENGDFSMMPKMDLYRKDGKVYVEAELPGIKPEDVDLHVYTSHLTFSAEKKSERKDEKEGQTLRSERFYGKVERQISFPVDVDPDSAKATFKDGVLTVEISENVKPNEYKKVDVSAA